MIPPVYFVDYVVDPRRPGQSGLSDIVWDMAAELARQGGEPHVFGPYATIPRPGGGVQLHPFRVPPFGYRNVFGHIALVLSAYREIRRLRRRGVVHVPEYVSSAVIASLCRDLPVVLTVPGSIHQKLASGTNPYDAMFTVALRIAARLSARRCVGVIAPSREMEIWWARTGTPDSRLVRLPLGVDTAVFHRVTDARHRLGISDDRRVVLGVGRINKENGFATLIEAFAATSREVAGLDLHLVGEGPEAASLKALADRLGLGERVIWHGWLGRAELAALYSAADLFAFTALTAGLPRVVLEALACGAPVVSSTVPGVTDHVVEGVTGYLVPPGSSEELAKKMVAVLEDSSGRSAVGAAALRHAQEQLSWKVIVCQLIKRVYRPLLTSPVLASGPASSWTG